MAAAALAKALLALSFGQAAAGGDGGAVSLVQSTFQAESSEGGIAQVEGLFGAKPKKIRFAPTEIQVDEGVWVPCRILSRGSRLNSYNVEVKPADFSSYKVSNVAASMLKKVKVIRDFIPVEPKAPAVAPVQQLNLKSATGEESFHYQVVDNLGRVTKFHTLRRSPLRTVKKMACMQAGVTWYKCHEHVKLSWKDRVVGEEDHPTELGMTDGETVHMDLSGVPK